MMAMHNEIGRGVDANRVQFNLIYPPRDPRDETFAIDHLVFVSLY